MHRVMRVVPFDDSGQSSCLISPETYSHLAFAAHEKDPHMLLKDEIGCYANCQLPVNHLFNFCMYIHDFVEMLGHMPW